MKGRHLISGLVMLAVGVGTGNPVLAGGGDVLGGLIVGGLVGAAIANDQNHRRAASQRSSRPRTTAPKSSISAAQREQNREVQTALNYFGYPVGTPDGSIGPKSRAAISQYQALLNFPPTGQLAEMERQILVTAYNRAMIGGPQVQQVVSTSPQGIRGMLLAQRNEVLGVGQPTYATAPMGTMPNGMPNGQMPMPTQAPMMAQPMPMQPMPMPGTAMPAPTAVAQPQMVQPQMPVAALPLAAVAVAQPTPGAAMPSFGAAMAPPSLTLTGYCGGISAKSGVNGALQTVAALSDPAQALGEQFCAVSAAAKAESDTLAAQVAGFTPAQIADQCRGFAAALKDQVARVATTPRDDMVAAIQSWIKTAGMPEDQLVSTSKVCLGVGYGIDAPDMALASALVLTGTGNMVYAELVGHHLTSGVGTTAQTALALDWYDVAANALSVGQTPVFLPEQADRATLIHKASMALNGRAEAVPMLPTPVAAPVTAPVTTAVAAPAPAPDLAPTVSTKSASAGGIAGLAGLASSAAGLVAAGATLLPAQPANAAP